MRTREDDLVVPVGREVWADTARRDSALSGTDAVLHFAGVNRAANESLLQQNVGLAEQLTESLDRSGSRPFILYANSTQSGNPSPFGQAKEQAAEHLRAWGKTNGAPVADLRLPNLFGEHGRPHYNSVVATFCHLLASGGEPEIIEDRTISLLHVQDALDGLLRLLDDPSDLVLAPEGRPMAVSELRRQLTRFREIYKAGEIPDIRSSFDRALFNTYRSFCFPSQFPIIPQLRSDARGELFECIRAHGSECQLFCSTTHPGVTRGNHFHRRKVERFMVLQGSAAISLRRLGHTEVIVFDVSGDSPVAIDIPTLWAHSITNQGQTELMTLFWTDEVFDPSAPDTYSEMVTLAEASA